MLWKRHENKEGKTEHYGGPLILDWNQTKSVLGECCMRKLPAVVIMPDVGATCRTSFSAQTSETVYLTVTDEITHEFRPLSTCFVSFCAEGRGLIFVASVQEANESQQTRRRELMLSVPMHIVSTEIRRWYRVPVVPDAGLQTWVTLRDGSQVATHCINISLGGLMVEFSERTDPDLALSTLIPVEAQYNDMRLVFSAEVRRRSDQKYGFYVPPDVRDDRVYRQLVTALEREWLQRRAYTQQDE